jgi:hypothetical protein
MPTLARIPFKEIFYKCTTFIQSNRGASIDIHMMAEKNAGTRDGREGKQQHKENHLGQHGG